MKRKIFSCLIIEGKFWVSILLDVRNWNEINVLTSKNVMQNGQNSVAGSEAINSGMSGIIEKLIKSVTGNVS